MLSRKNIRQLSTLLLSIFSAVIILPVAGQWWIQAATDKGLYAGAGRTLDTVASIVVSKGVLCALFALFGLVAGLWLDLWITRRDHERSSVTRRALAYWGNPGDIVKPNAFLHQGVSERSLGRTWKGYISDRLSSDAVFKLPYDFGDRVELKNRIFERCTFIGPACIVMQSCSVAGIWHTQNSIEEAIIEIKRDRFNYLFTSVLGFSNCSFVDCDFYKVSIVSSKQQADSMRKLNSSVDTVPTTGRPA